MEGEGGKINLPGNTGNFFFGPEMTVGEGRLRVFAWHILAMERYTIEIKHRGYQCKRVTEHWKLVCKRTRYNYDTIVQQQRHATCTGKEKRIWGHELHPPHPPKNSRFYLFSRVPYIPINIFSERQHSLNQNSTNTYQQAICQNTRSCGTNQETVNSNFNNNTRGGESPGNTKRTSNSDSSRSKSSPPEPPSLSLTILYSFFPDLALRLNDAPGNPTTQTPHSQ